ncbi:hypothetical protein ElyMa_000172300, partial [Elysia marginata]
METFMPVLKQVWQRCNFKDHLKDAFEVSGFLPWNPEALDYEKYEEYSKSSTSADNHDPLDIKVYLADLANTDKISSGYQARDQ